MQLFGIKHLGAALLLLLSSTAFCSVLGRGGGHTPGKGGKYDPSRPPLTPSPWFTGPIVTPAAYVVPAGHYNIEPYFYWITDTAAYDKEWHSKSIPHFHEFLIQIPTQIGVTSFMSFEFSPQMMHQWTEGQSSTRFGDLPITFSFQLLKDGGLKSWQPCISVGIEENLPTGKYRRLDPTKLGTDVSGIGSFATSGILAFSKLIQFGQGINYLSTRLYFDYTYFAPVYVKGFNTFGGGFGTRGHVYMGNIFTSMLGLEFSLTQNWVLAFDLVNVYGNKVRFSGKNGHLANGTPASNTSPSFNQISIAPGIEYNWNEHVGIIGGVWFTVTGRNQKDYLQGIIALNWYI